MEFQAFEARYKLCVEEDDAIIFLNDSLFSLTMEEFGSKVFDKLTNKTAILCVNEQVVARAVSSNMPLCVSQIDYKEFVELSQNSSKIVSW